MIPRDEYGEPVAARDVLDDQEQAEYAAAQRLKPRPMRRLRRRHRVDELGYDELGRWHPEHDPEEFR